MTDEQRSLGEKELPPGGLRRIWHGALLLLSHRALAAMLLRRAYQELIFHAGLTGPDCFLLWNPRQRTAQQNPDHFATDEQDKLVNDCLARLTELAGEADRVTLVTNLAGWYDDYILTGMRAGGREVWRFTPNLESGQSRDDVVVSVTPPIFRTRQVEIRFDNARILKAEAELSQLGFWILSSSESPPLIVKPESAKQ